MIGHSPEEGAGNAGRSMRARSLACEMKKARKQSHRRFAGFTRHSPRGWF
jgi:hypothetical protein